MSPRVLLFANPRKPEASALARRARAIVTAHGGRPFLVSSRDIPPEAGRPDMVVAFGGDGTVLAALHALMADGRRVSPAPLSAPPLPPLPPLAPLLGVNVGRLGFLTDVAPEDMENCLPPILEGRLAPSPRMMAEVEIRSDGRPAWHGLSVNEALVASAQPGRAVRLEARVNGERVMSFTGDGLLAATPTGSTAHALSAGGPVLSERVRALILAPVCPHRLSLRPLVAGPGETIEIMPVSASSDAGDPERASAREAACAVSIDGQVFHPLAVGDRVKISVAPAGWSQFRPSGTVYQFLRRKLGWDGGCEG